MEFIDFNAITREKTRKGPARVLRREGMVPAILYGPGKESLKIAVNAKDFVQVMKKTASSQAFFTLTIGNGAAEKRIAMVKEIQQDPVSRAPIHIDFLEIAMDRKISAMVPVKTTGKSAGVEMGGMLQIIRRELEVWCLPSNIPDKVVIDVTNLGIGDAVHVEEIDLGEDVEIPHEVDYTVVTVIGKKKEAAEEEEALEEGEEEAEAAEGEE